MRRARPSSSSSSSSRSRGVAVPRPTPAVAPARRVLVVHDDPTERDLLVQSLAEKGYQAFGACDSQQAFREVFLRWPDLIVLDLDLPVLDGWEFLRVQSEYPRLVRIPVVALSAADTPSTVAAIIRRPMVVGDVLDAVHRIIGPGAGRPLLSIVRGEIGP
jgi:CheY-like chemotaxis protein